MADNPPYMNAYGLISKILTRIQEAQTPPRFTYDFLSTKLGIKSSSARAVVRLLKRIGFIGPDGVPTERYDQFKNPQKSGMAMAAGIRQGYPDLFSRHEYANQINKNELEGLVLEVTGLEKKSQVVGAIIGTFEALKAFADFEITDDQLGGAEQEPENIKEDVRSSDGRADFQFGLGYTVNINLPETTNVAVYDAIFKSISEHLVKRKG